MPDFPRSNGQAGCPSEHKPGIDGSGTDHSAWLQPIAKCLAANEHRGMLLITVPQYRPDLIQQMASHFTFELVDVRAEWMAPLGWDAHTLTLAEAAERLHQRAEQSGLVAHNCDALLASKPHTERLVWLHAIGEREWPNPVLLPLTVFAEDAPAQSKRVCAVSAEELPEQTLISRLAF